MRPLCKELDLPGGSMKDFSLVIFDFDGTLADTRDDIVESVRLSLVDLGLTPPPAECIAGHIGRGILHLLGNVLPAGREELLQPVHRRFRIHYESNCTQGSTLYPDVEMLLDRLLRREAFLAVASNKPSIHLRTLLNHFGLTGRFRRILGGNDMERKKPDPWCVETLLDQSGISRSRAIMIGDMRYDMETGVAAGIHTCGVTYGYGSEEELRRAGAEFLVPSLSRLLDLIG